MKRIGLFLLLCLVVLTGGAKSIKEDAFSGFALYAAGKVQHQSSANYGRWLFLLTNRMDKVYLFDMEQKRMVFLLELPPHEEKCSTDGVLSDVLYHCNAAAFGKERFDKDDFFPLLYVSQRNRMEDNRALLSVLRIKPSMGANGYIDSFKVEEVQQILYPAPNDKNCMGAPNTAIDANGGFLYPYCRNNRTDAPNFLQAHVAKLVIPKLRDQNGNVVPTVKLEDKDILDSFGMDWSALAGQSAVVADNKLLLMQGFPSKKAEKNHVWLRVVDLKKKRQTFARDLIPMGFKWEPEGVFIYNGRLFTSVNKGGIWEMTFDR